MNAVLSMFESEAPMPDMPVELIQPQRKARWAWYVWTVALSALTIVVIPESVIGESGLALWGRWLHRMVDTASWSDLKLLVPFAAICAVSVVCHELIHLAAATLLGRVPARFTAFHWNPAVFWHGSLSRNNAIATALLPFILLGILPLFILAQLSPLHALILYIPISQNLIASRFDIAQAFYMARCLPADARVYCHPEGLAYALRELN